MSSSLCTPKASGNASHLMPHLFHFTQVIGLRKTEHNNSHRLLGFQKSTESMKFYFSFDPLQLLKSASMTSKSIALIIINESEKKLCLRYLFWGILSGIASSKLWQWFMACVLRGGQNSRETCEKGRNTMLSRYGTKSRYGVSLGLVCCKQDWFYS